MHHMTEEVKLKILGKGGKHIKLQRQDGLCNIYHKILHLKKNTGPLTDS